MRTRFRLSFSGIEKKIIAVLVAIFFLSNIGIIHAFYVDNSDVRPAVGGTLIEGMVGNLDEQYSFNPLFADGIEEDVVSLIFAGLMRYDSDTGEIKDYIATHTLSPDKQVYEFKLHENVFWHDGRPVTADDIMFTYHDVIQHPEYTNTSIKNAFAEIKIEKIDNITVRFTIPEKRKTFFTNFTLGILPKHLLENTPVSGLEFDSFNQQPVGCGPYEFESILRTPEYAEIRLTSFPEAYGQQPKVETVGLRVFANKDQLFANAKKLDAIRPLRSQEVQEINKNDRFQSFKVIGPRYVAVFFNLKNENLTTKKIRQSMRAAIDTNAMAERFDGVRIDTPFVELWPQDDVVNVSKTRADELMRSAGYLFDSERNPAPDETIQEKPTATPTPSLTPSPTATPTAFPSPTPNTAYEDTKYVSEPSNKLWSATGTSKFYLVGSIPDNTTKVSVNGYQLQLFNPTTGRFTYLADTTIGTLKEGENKFTVEFRNSANEVLDAETVTIFYSADPAAVKAAEEAKTIAEKISLAPEPVEVPLLLHAVAAAETEVQEPLISPSGEATSSSPEVTPEAANNTYRSDDNGNHIALTLTYLKSFDYLEEVATELQQDWQQIGIEITLLPLGADDFRTAIRNREYELILLPQHLGYNLDSYPYFHLSQVGEGGFNFSEWKNLKASVLLESIRATHDAAQRRKDLEELSGIFIDDVPAITLFTPYYTWLVDSKIHDIKVNHMAVLSDRFSLVNDFYIREARQFSEDKSVKGFFPWFGKQNKQFFSFSSDE